MLKEVTLLRKSSISKSGSWLVLVEGEEGTRKFLKVEPSGSYPRARRSQIVLALSEPGGKLVIDAFGGNIYVESITYPELNAESKKYWVDQKKEGFTFLFLI